MQKLPISIIAAVAAFGIAGGAQAANLNGSATAEPAARLVVGVFDASQPMSLEKTQFFYSGRNYCWYLNGWRGPGYYWCGYNWRRGYGWGGPRGWNNWGGGWRDGWSGHGWRPGYRGPRDLVGRPVDRRGWRGDHYRRDDHRDGDRRGRDRPY